MQWTNNKFITTLGISIVLAFGMISVVFGVIYLSSGGDIPVPLPALLMAFAIVFVLGSVFFEDRGADRVGALVGGSIVAAIVSLITMLVCGGVLYLLTNGMETGIDKIVSMLAVCMVIGMAAFSYLRAHR
ncbi:MAG: heat-shock protein [ANME-2 cluster archaeon]|jgi:amino acid transporter|nr:MAG: heat-shock protein [ANME-2 cluster archaeon]